MAHVIGDDCISCGSCEAECPVSAISEGDANTRSTLMLVSTVVHVQHSAQ